MSQQKNIIVFHGKSDLTIKKKIHKIINDEIPEHQRNLGVTHFRNVKNDDSSQNKEVINETLFSLPLGCDRQVVVVWNYQNVYSSSEFLNLLPNISKDTWAIFVSYQSLQASVKKKLSTISQVEIVQEYYVKWEQIRQYLNHFLKENDLNTNRETIDFLVHFFSESPSLIESELDKISSYFNPHEKVTIQNLVGILSIDQNQQVVFDVVDAFFTKNPKITLKKFKKYLSHYGDLQLLVSLLVKELILIVKFKEMQVDRLGEDKIFRELGVVFEKQKKC